MTDDAPSATPTRDARHEALAPFLGRWRAEGTSYGGPSQSDDDPRAHGVPWTSTHEARWHTGEFFLVQDERAIVGGQPFDTLGIAGVDPDGDGYVLRTIENHGFYRHYAMTVAGRVWTITGATERARIELDAAGRMQTIAWEWKPRARWLPLCDRVARRID